MMREEIQKRPKHQRFVVLFMILIALIFVRYVLGVAFPVELLLVAVAVIAALGDRDEIIAMCLCCTPMYTSMQYVYALGLCMVIYVIKYYDTIRVNSAVVLILAMLAWEWLHCLDEYSSVIGAVRVLIPWVFCIFLTFCQAEQINFQFVSRVFAGCVALMCLVVLSRLLVDSGYNIRTAFVNMQRLGTVSSEAETVGADFNPNFLGFLCVVSSTCLLQLRMALQGRKTDVILVVFLLLCGLLTLSRTFLLCVALMVVMLILANGYSIKKVIKMLGSVLGIGMVVLIVLKAAFPENLEEWVSRFQVEDITSGRLELMVRYHNRIIESPDILLFGVGTQSVTEKVVRRFGSAKILGTVVPHNAIQEMVFCWGVMGLLLLLAFLVCLLRSAKRKNPGIKFSNYILLILFLVKIQAGQLITTPSNVIIFGLAYLSMCYSFDNVSCATVRSESLS